MKYLIIDACFGGTGIREKYGGHIDPGSMFLSEKFIAQLKNWLELYNTEFLSGFPDYEFIEKLDEEGKKIAISLVKELTEEAKVEYYSDAKMTFLTISTD